MKSNFGVGDRMSCISVVKARKVSKEEGVTQKEIVIFKLNVWHV